MTALTIFYVLQTTDHIVKIYVCECVYSGDPGLPGSKGEDGNKGATGPRGDPGDRGPRGPIGYTIYTSLFSYHIIQETLDYVDQ